VIDRGNMASALGWLGPKRGKAAIPALLKVMAGSGEYARVNAAWALLDIDPSRGTDVLPVARAGLKDPVTRYCGSHPDEARADRQGHAARPAGRLEDRPDL
jgi:hypothetical protein